MNRFFTLLLAASCLTAVGQVPDYVPTEGLVGWYSLDGDVGQFSFNTSQGESSGINSTQNRFSQPQTAVSIGGEDFCLLNDVGSLDAIGEWTFSIWIRPISAIQSIDYPHIWRFYDPDSYASIVMTLMGPAYPNEIEGQIELYMTDYEGVQNPEPPHLWEAIPSLDVWSHVVARRENGEISVFLNSLLTASYESSDYGLDSLILTGLTLGGNADYPLADNRIWLGDLDDAGVWGRALSEAEIFSLYNAPGPLEGCSDESACNFDATATLDDGSCHFNCQFCLTGTVWSEELGGCIGDGSGDINLDGCVQLNDLLDLLSAYGDCGAEETPWQCGDPLEYQGYDYETVQIGEQCWFAENLRAENYRNGEAITSVIDQPDYSSLWLNTSANEEGALNVYPQYESNGMVYNWYAVVDDNDLCPEGWSVPSKSNYESLIEYAELVYADDFVFSLVDDTQGLGTNETGYSATTTGYVDGQNGLVYAPTGQFQYMWFWTSTLGPFPDAWSWRINTSFGNPINQGTTNQLKSRGLAVRCIKDAE